MNIEQNGMSENFDMPFCYAFLCEIRRKSDHVLRAEPVGIEIGKTERFIQCDRRRVSLDNLKICFRCTEPDSLGEDCAADRGSVVAVAVRRMHMDGIDTDVIAVADAKAGGNDRSGCRICNRFLPGNFCCALSFLYLSLHAGYVAGKTPLEASCGRFPPSTLDGHSDGTPVCHHRIRYNDYAGCH